MSHDERGAINAMGLGASMPITFGISRTADNETIPIAKMNQKTKINRIHFWTAGALGSSLGIDIIDGGSDASGTDVIDSCTDNLSGKESIDVDPGYVLHKGDWLNVKFDDFASAIFCNVIVEGEILQG